MGFASHIFVATDFSDASQNAVAAAAELARGQQALGTKVTLFHSFDPDPLVPPGVIPSPARYEAKIVDEMEAAIVAKLTEIRDRSFAGVADVSIVVGHGHSAAAAICDAAKREGADLIVIATHGRTGLSRLIIGSVAERVVRHAHCPVLAVRPVS